MSQYNYIVVLVNVEAANDLHEGQSEAMSLSMLLLNEAAIAEKDQAFIISCLV